MVYTFFLSRFKVFIVIIIVDDNKIYVDVSLHARYDIITYLPIPIIVA